MTLFVFRDVFRNPVHGAISTPGMLEGRDKVNFQPDAMIAEEAEVQQPSTDSSLANLSLDKINAQLYARDSEHDPENQQENSKQKVIPTLSEPPMETLNNLNIKRKIGITMSDPLCVTNLNVVADVVQSQDKSGSSRMESQISDVSNDENDRRGSALSENSDHADKTADTRL